MTICDFDLTANIPLPDGLKAIPKTLGDKIKKVRFERRLQQIEVARLLGVNYSTIRRWETNEVRITPMYLKRVLKFLQHDKENVTLASKN